MMLTKKTTGQAIRVKASEYNAIVDSVAYSEAAEGKEIIPESIPEVEVGKPVMVMNASVDNLKQYDVIGITRVQIRPEDGTEDEFKDQIVLRGEVPDAALHRGRFAVCLEPIESGGVGQAVMSGLVQVKIDPGGSTGGPADIDPNSTSRLKLACYGSAEVIWREAGSGERWAVVRLGNTPPIFPVRLQRTGGAQGTYSTAATWVYDIIDKYSNEILRSGVSIQRASWGATDEANAGLAGIVNGVVTLFWTNEVFEPTRPEHNAFGHSDNDYPI